MQKKLFDKIQYSFMIKTFQKVGKEATYLNIMKTIYDKLTDNIILNGEKLEAFPLRSGRQGCPLLSLLFNIKLSWLGSPNHGKQIKKKKKMKGIQIGKEVKLSLFANDMIPYIENPEDATRKLLELSNEVGEVAVL